MPIDGNLNDQFYTPAVVLGLAAARAGFTGAEAAAFRLCEIHAFGAPRRDLKSCLTRLSKAFIAENIGFARSAGYKAVDSLIRRRVLLVKGKNALVINKWVDQWLTPEGRTIFREGSEAVGSILASLRRADWWQIPAAAIEPMAPRGATRQLAFQSSGEDRANAVPSSGEDTPEDQKSTTEDKTDPEKSSTGDKKSPTEDTEPAETRHQGGARPRAERDLGDIGSALTGDGKPVQPLAAFALSNCWKGKEVCKMLAACSGKHLHNDWVTALQELANNPNPQGITSPAAYVRHIAQHPRRARFQQGITFSAWLTQQRQGAEDNDAAPADGKAVYKHSQGRDLDPESPTVDTAEIHPPTDTPAMLAECWAARPSAEQLGAIDEMRRAKQDRLKVLQLEKWFNTGRPTDQRSMKTLQQAMAAGETTARRLAAGLDL